MDFGALPPEINSGRMYVGVGPATLLAASAAWEGLASELHAAASGYQLVIAGLTDESWIGPSSVSMAAAVTPYLIWMRETAAQCEAAASQAAAAASAYETAFALTVPPPMVEANRVQLAMLVATNLLGQNTPAIMATEAEYSEMWAQDATAMYGYAANSASATTFSPFTPAPRTTNPDAPTQAAGTTAESTSSQSAVPQALQGLSTPGSSSAMGTASGMASSAASGPPGALSSLTGTSKGATKGASTGLRATSGLAAGGASELTGGTAGLASDVAGLGSDAAGLGADGGGIGLDVYGVSLDLEGAGSILEAEGAGANGLGGLGLMPLSGLGTGAAASLGQATPLGTLSVPPTWAHAVSSVAPLPPVEGGTPTRWGTTLASPPSTAVSKLPLGGMVGRESAGSVQRVGHHPALIPRSPVAG